MKEKIYHFGKGENRITISSQEDIVIEGGDLSKALKIIHKDGTEEIVGPLTKYTLNSGDVIIEKNNENTLYFGEGEKQIVCTAGPGAVATPAKEDGILQVTHIDGTVDFVYYGEEYMPIAGDIIVDNFTIEHTGE